MNTIKRGKKNNDIVLQLAKTWNKKLKECMDRRGFTSNKAFAQAFKEEYGTGNATDVGRWLHVGEHFGNNSTIGFPSYDTMKRIADFLGVTVGYLTGETTCETFEMEEACSYLMINRKTGEAIENITKGKCSHGVDRYKRTDYTAAFEHLITANSFPLLLKGLCHYAAALYQAKHNYLEEIFKDYDDETLDIAMDYLDVSPYEDLPDLPPKIIEAMHRISDAMDEQYDQMMDSSIRIKAEKYSLSEIFLQLVNESVNDDTIDDLLVRAHTRYASLEELEKILRADGSPSEELEKILESDGSPL